MKRILYIPLAALAGVLLALLLTVGNAAAESDSDYLFDGEGTYYITGVRLGVSLTFREGSSLLSLSDGKLSEKKDCTRFRLEACGPNRYVIRPDCALYMYLTYGYAEQLIVERDTMGSVPDKGQWRVVPKQGGVQLVNVANGHVLVTYGLEAALKPAEEAEQVSDGETSLWLLMKTTCYGTDENAQVRELQVEEKTVEKAVTKSSATSYCDLFGFSWGPFSRPEDFAFSVDAPEVMSISGEGVITVKDNGTATITARHRYTGQKLSATLRVSNNAIIIVPGFMGSELKNSDGDKIWSESLLSELSNGVSLSALSKFMDLGSPSSKDGITAYNNYFGALDLYKTLYRTLSMTYGKDYTLEFYAYDWRRSSGTTGPELARYLEKKNYDNIILVTHSFGGLVCGQALAASETLREHTAMLCMVGVPVNGTAGIAQAWAQDRFGNVLGLGSFGSVENGAIRKIICTLPSVYEMLPSVYAVETAGVIGSCSSYSSFLSACGQSCSSFNRSLAEDAGKVNEKLYIDGKSVFDMVPTIRLGGTGYDTATAVSVSGGKLSFGNTTDGDGILTRDDCVTGIAPETQDVTGVPSRHLWLCEEQSVVDAVCAAIDRTFGDGGEEE
ncbi:MAG: hypothetical protein J5649_04325 [Lachnospiraceae bacterium]|nr:hypothetical protein [Lachnospiraceae bacterium]